MRKRLVPSGLLFFYGFFSQGGTKWWYFFFFAESVPLLVVVWRRGPSSSTRAITPVSCSLEFGKEKIHETATEGGELKLTRFLLLFNIWN